MAKHGNQLRIIGGRWRSRQLTFPSIDGLRPTPNRVRETLFNWLAPRIEGACCLDLFAGSGILGIEALSRGAKTVVFVEQHPAAAKKLRENLLLLGMDATQVEQIDAQAWLKGRPQPFDLVLLDPPFGQDLLIPVCEALEEHGWLVPRAQIYLETDRALKNPKLPSTWEIVREKNAGQVIYRLAIRKP